MADVVPPAVRSRMMAGIRSKDTRPELALRRALHAAGLRYRLHVKDMSGRPDLVFPRWNAVVFVHGCFWHGHDCALFRWPQTRMDFWRAKIGRNRERDASALRQLASSGWRSCIVWECALKGPGRLELERVVADCARWIKGSKASLVIRGRT